MLPAKLLRRSSAALSAPATTAVVWFVILLLSCAASQARTANGVTTTDLERVLGLEFNPELAQQIGAMLTRYNQNPHNGALAVAVGTDASVALGMATAAESETAASLAALAQCDTQRSEANIAGHCEVLLHEQTLVPTGRGTKRKYSGQDRPSLLWRIDGLRTPDQSSARGRVYLGGTIHVLKQTLYPLPRAYRLAFAQADQLALEINPLLESQPDRQAEVAALLRADPQQVIRSLDPQLKAQLDRYLTEQGGNPRRIYQLPPAMTAMQLAILKYIALGFLPQAGIDLHFARLAAGAGKPIHELETVTEALNSLVSLPLATQSQLLEQTLSELDNALSVVQPMIDAWFAGDLQQLQTQFALSTGDNPALIQMQEQVIAQRNQNWLPKLEMLLQEAHTTLVLVGAGHLGGTSGLLQLLRQAGYHPVQLNQAGEPFAAAHTGSQSP